MPKRRPRKRAKLDFSDMPTFHDPDPLVSERHDQYLYGRRK